MKNVLLTLLLILLLSTSGHAQARSSLAFIGGMDYGYRLLGADGGTAEVIKDLRNDGEVSRLGWRAGVNYNRQLTQHVYLRLGARYVQTGYGYRSALRWGAQHDGQGGFDPNAGSGSFGQIDVKYNYYFLELPATVGKVWSAKKLRPFVEAGLAPTLLLTANTKVRAGENLSTGSDDTDFSQLQFVGILSGGISYPLSDRWRLVAQPTLRYHFTKLVDASLRENLMSAGLELGVRRGL